MNASQIRFTYIGGPTLLIEIGSLRLLTDPTFDDAGGDYDIGLAVLRKTQPPVLSAASVGNIDAVLLSHDHHADNLDDAGRALLPSAKTVLTTVAGASRLQLPNVTGMTPWQTVTLADSPTPLRVTATPARHGPEGIEDVIGDVTGFVLEWGTPEDGGSLYVSGDTVWYEGVQQIADRFPHVRHAVLFLGGVRPAPGEPLLTLDAAEAVQVAKAMRLETVLPVHYEGWEHFAEGRDVVESVFASSGLATRLVWLTPGEAHTLLL